MRVVNLRKEKYTHYIGRGSGFGNPFIIGKDGTREEVIRKYEIQVRKYLFPLKSIDYKREIYNLPQDARLGCYCKPLACHGDIIIKIWKELHNEIS